MSRRKVDSTGGTNTQPPDDLANEINRMIEAVPAETPREALPERLKSIIGGMVLLDAPRAEACLSKIQFRFKLRREEVAAYRQLLRSKQKKLEEKAPTSTPKITPTADFPGLVDLAVSRGKMVFVTQDGKDLAIKDSFERGGSRYAPPRSAQIPWLLPRAEEIRRWYARDADVELYGDLLSYHRAISELPTDAHYDLLVLWVLHTYLLEWAQYSPMLWLYGVPERGKSRTGKGLIYVARRGIHVESLREAYLLRAAQDLKATLFIDVMDLSRKLERAGSEDILLQRFEKGTLVPRVLYPEKGPYQDTVYYEVFGATIIGTNEPIHHILETRSIPIVLPSARRSFENEVTPEGGRSYRERLVAFRARHLGESPPTVRKPAIGRLGDILKPLLQIAIMVHPERAPVILKLFADLQTARIIQKADSLEAQILLAVQACRGLAIDGVLPVGDVADRLNRDRAEKERVTSHKVGRRLSALGFDKTRTERNYSAIRLDPDHLARVMASYGLQETPETPQSPGPLSHNELTAGVSPEAAAPVSGTPESGPPKLRSASDWKSDQLEIGGVSGVSRRSSEGALRTDPEVERNQSDEEDFEERAAIMEFDGNVPRGEAEARAKAGRNGDER